MKLSDVEEWLLQLSWFMNAIIFSFISFTIVSIFLPREFQGPGSAVLLSVPAYLVWLCIILYCISSIAFCFTFAAIFYSCKLFKSFNLKVNRLLVSLIFDYSHCRFLRIHVGFYFINSCCHQSQHIAFGILIKVDVSLSNGSFLSRIPKNCIF